MKSCSCGISNVVVIIIFFLQTLTVQYFYSVGILSFNWKITDLLASQTQNTCRVPVVQYNFK